LIISFLNQKGGCGKTTLALNFASYVARVLERSPFDEVVLIETDRQESLSYWHNTRLDSGKECLQILSLQRVNALRSFKPSKKKLYVLDGGGIADDLCRASIKLSDMVVIPIKASPMDIWSMAPITTWIKERQEFTDGSPKSCYALSMTHLGSKLGRGTVGEFDGTDLDLIPGSIKDRVIYKSSAMQGLSVFDVTKDYTSNELLARQIAENEINYLATNILSRVEVAIPDPIGIGGTCCD